MSEKNDNQQILIEMKKKKSSHVLLETKNNNKIEVLLQNEEINCKKQACLEIEKESNHKKDALLDTESEQNCKKDSLPKLKKENEKIVVHEDESKFSVTIGRIPEEKSEKISLCHGNKTPYICCEIAHTSSLGPTSWWCVVGDPVPEKSVMSGQSEDTWIVWSNIVPTNRRAKIFGVEDEENPGTYLFITATDSNELVLRKNSLPESVDETDPRVLEYKVTAQTRKHTISKTVDNVVKYVVPESDSGNLLLDASHSYDWRMDLCDC